MNNSIIVLQYVLYMIGKHNFFSYVIINHNRFDSVDLTVSEMFKPIRSFKVDAINMPGRQTSMLFSENVTLW